MKKEDYNYIENTLRELSHFLRQKREEERWRVCEQESEQRLRSFYVVGSLSPEEERQRRDEQVVFFNRNAERISDNAVCKLNTHVNAKERHNLLFSKKEINNMPKQYKNIFACRDMIITYRQKPNGVYECRLRRNNLHIEVSSKDLSILKKKFVDALEKATQPTVKQPCVDSIYFKDCLNSWLDLKRRTTKPSTFSEYERLSSHDIFPTFGEMHLPEITRDFIQRFLFKYTDAQKYRTAEKIHLILRCIFDLAADDFGLRSPMKNVVLPYHESKSGNALTLEEERLLVDYCINNPTFEASSALLVLLYFGLRRSELKTIKTTGESLTCISSKTLMGRNEVERTIPFLPVFRRVLKHVDFERAKNVNMHTLNSAMKRILPTHHLHELRYTFITRCKECGVNPEIVMLWDGHESDKDVKSSKIDRGYTDFSWTFQLSEAKKVDYDL